MDQSVVALVATGGVNDDYTRGETTTMDSSGGTPESDGPRIDAEHTSEQFYIIYDRANSDAWIQSDYHVDRTGWR
ncbi:hypothetical protein [Halorhabdus rudnickae]|uniref:hypothetical protein n=1 Tax=Halorhabdus rudnickae TaxID=1775544 RepID=UPI0010834C7E|nr:hypothetical protein [Halorhabdus rudnickae]